MLTDLRFALRQLAKTPAFTAIALLTLAVGIGSATVVFSAINALILRPLPLVTVPEHRLLFATQTETRLNQDIGWNYPDFLALRERTTTLAGLWVHTDRTIIIPGSKRPERLLGTEISWDAFNLMGVLPVEGRGFTAQDEKPGAEAVALISAALWHRRYGGAPEVIGTAVTINHQPATIIGVMPPGWRYPDFTDVWTPLRPDPAKPAMRGNFNYSGRALLKPGVTLAAAQAETDVIFRALEREFPATNGSVRARLRPIREEAIEDTEHFTLLLFGAVLFVFLIACVNVANLLLARAVTRSKEFAIRLALGANRARVIRQLVTESVALALLGGVGGLIVGLWGNDAMVAAMPIQIPFWLRFDFDLRVFAFVFGLSLIAALVFGLVPALRTSQPDVVNELKEGGRSSEISGPRALRLRSLLVIAQIALALVLLVGAGLMMRSSLALRKTQPGFSSEGVLTFRTGFPAGLVGEDRDLPARFFDRLLEKLASIPGVESAALMSWRPAHDDGGSVGIVLPEGEARPATLADSPMVHNRVVSGNFFSTLRIPLLAGRLFDDAIDRRETPGVVLVDETFARRHYGAPAAALGKRLERYEHEAMEYPPQKPKTVEIIGVVGGIRHRLDQPDKHPTIYATRRQWTEFFQTVVVRVATPKPGEGNTALDPALLIEPARDAVSAVHHEIPIYEEGPLEDALLRSGSVWPRRFFGYLFMVFGLVALFLACIGIYGLMSYNVTQRVQELGVRLALGAQPHEIIQLVVRQGLRLIGWGLGAGLVAAFLLTRFLTGFLYGVSPHDPPTFALVPLLLATVALLACWLPSLRATRIEPNAALRSE